jgi:hypothetical protein
MYVAMIKGKADVPERFWNKAVAETEEEKESLVKQGYCNARIELNSRSEALAWINR